MSQEKSSYHNDQIEKFAKDEAEVVDVVLVMDIVSEKLKIVKKTSVTTEEQSLVSS